MRAAAKRVRTARAMATGTMVFCERCR
jgi:hypothetical protein